MASRWSQDISSSSLVLGFLVLLLRLQYTDASSGETTTIYVVYMGRKMHDDPSVVMSSHHAALTSILGSKDAALKSIVYSYNHGFSGFAAKLTEAQAEELRKYPGVVRVKPNTYHKLHTTRSWDYLGMSYGQQPSTGSSSRLLRKAKYGEDAIVGVIDTGIWPESRSFDDTGYGPVPKRWKGVCQTGQAFNASHCNRKIIGARWFAGDASKEDLKGEYMSARDAEGHGTHTASTIAGLPVRVASYGGLAAGLARGGAPRARLAMYKACFGPCGDASVIAAIDAAIGDGVDVLSMSLVNFLGYMETQDAVSAGITVVLAAGNYGPVQQSVQNALPWGITVAAATVDRYFPTAITFGSGEKVVGQSLFYHNRSTASNSKDEFRSLYLALEGCDESKLRSANIAGKIIVCVAPPFPQTYPPSTEFIKATQAAIAGGAKGIIFEQYSTDGLDYQEYCQGHMPCVVVDRETIFRIIQHLGDDRPVAKISPAATVFGAQVASPRVATFSARGPSAQFPGILKPDIAAPGVSILAAKGDSYELMSGTSMACPHVAAVVALLKSVHPDWSPAMIKSAIVTTASVTDRFGLPIQANSVQRKPADPFDFGGGLIQPDKAMDPGLVYDITPEDYNNDDLSAEELNLPSIAVPDLKESVTVQRTVTNVGPAKAAATYRAVVEAPAGVRMSVEPPVISFKKGGARNATFKVTFVAKQRVQGGYTFGSLTWLDDGKKHSVRIPVAVRTIVWDFVADTS